MFLAGIPQPPMSLWTYWGISQQTNKELLQYADGLFMETVLPTVSSLGNYLGYVFSEWCIGNYTIRGFVFMEKRRQMDRWSNNTSSKPLVLWDFLKIKQLENMKPPKDRLVLIIKCYRNFAGTDGPNCPYGCLLNFGSVGDPDVDLTLIFSLTPLWLAFKPYLWRPSALCNADCTLY